MKLYTKSGDDGTTGLYGGSRISKKSARISAIGDIDELNATIGLARVYSIDEPLDGMLAKIQNWLFDLGAELACPPDGKFTHSSITQAHSDLLERSIDEQCEQLPPLKAFILPGGSILASQLHLCRCSCRRAERSVIELDGEETVRDEIKVFLNRLSDWLFASARTANQSRNVNDIEWMKSEDM